MNRIEELKEFLPSNSDKVTNIRDYVESAQFSPNGRLVLTKERLTVHIFDFITGRELSLIRVSEDWLHWISKIIFSSDGKSILVITSSHKIHTLS